MKKYFLASMVSLALAGLPGLALAESETPEVSTEGMQLVDKDSRGSIYADPGVDWTIYSKVKLDNATVAFRKNWMRDQNRSRSLSGRITTSDMEKIKSELATIFDEVFTEELNTNGGFEIVEQAGDDVLRITPRIVDLNIYAPDTGYSGMNRSYTDSSGIMTLKLELYDSVTGDLIAVASDRQESRETGYRQWTTSGSNKADARNMLKKWAKGLRVRLNEATGVSP